MYERTCEAGCGRHLARLRGSAEEAVAEGLEEEAQTLSIQSGKRLQLRAEDAGWTTGRWWIINCKLNSAVYSAVNIDVYVVANIDVLF